MPARGTSGGVIKAAHYLDLHSCHVLRPSIHPVALLLDMLDFLPEYLLQTTPIVTTDHGRGATAKDWTDHGRDVPPAVSTWIAALGPAVAPAGLRDGVVATTSQIAATAAAAVGEDFRHRVPKAAAPIPLSK